ncbi:hypothetical protein C8J56DRAFT_1054110 [Mycena floridula]|nr:hypothetical protein C8J56DRAFT_1054110 [Mycena floridula]
MSDFYSILASVISIALKVKESIEKVAENHEKRRALVKRIDTSLVKLKNATNGITRASPRLVNAVSGLKTDLQKTLTRLNQPMLSSKDAKPRFAQWLHRDVIEAALRDIEKQIANCFHEFNVLSNIRIERKLDKNNAQVNGKLDELLRRSSNREKVKDSTVTQRKRSSSSATRQTTSVSPQRRRSESLKSTPVSRIAPSRRSTEPVSTKVVSKAGSSRAATCGTQIDTASTFSTSTAPDLRVRNLQDERARELSAECKRKRDDKLPEVAITLARKALHLRRSLYESDKSTYNTASLAQTLSTVSLCLKELGTDDRGELLKVLTESAELYRDLFAQGKDGDYRLELATSLYNLAVHASEVALKAKDSVGLYAALQYAEDSVVHWKKLHQKFPTKHVHQLMNAYINLSFILTDCDRHGKALDAAQRGVAMASKLDKDIRPQALHRSLLRVSHCFKRLGKIAESEAAEKEATATLSSN